MLLKYLPCHKSLKCLKTAYKVLQWHIMLMLLFIHIFKLCYFIHYQVIYKTAVIVLPGNCPAIFNQPVPELVIILQAVYVFLVVCPDICIHVPVNIFVFHFCPPLFAHMTYKRGQDGQVKRKALFYAPCAYLWKWANKGTSKGCLLAYLSFICP